MSAVGKWLTGTGTIRPTGKQLKAAAQQRKRKRPEPTTPLQALAQGKGTWTKAHHPGKPKVKGEHHGRDVDDRGPEDDADLVACPECGHEFEPDERPGE